MAATRTTAHTSQLLPEPDGTNHLAGPLRLVQAGPSSSNQADLTLDGFGDLTISPSGLDTTINGNLHVTGTITPLPSTPPSGPAYGDLTGTYPNPTITDGAVSNNKLNAMPGLRLKGNNNSLAGPPLDITVAQAATMLGGQVAGTLALGNDPRFGGVGGSGPPTGPAGGDLVGSTYPNPVVAPGKITRGKTAADLWLSPIPTGADAGKVLTVAAGPTLAWATPAAAPSVGPDLALSGHLITGAAALSGSPPARIEAVDAGAPQLRLSRTAGSLFTDLFTDSSGYLNIEASGGWIQSLGGFSGTQAQFQSSGTQPAIVAVSDPGAAQFNFFAAGAARASKITSDVGGNITVDAGAAQNVTIIGKLTANVGGDLLGTLPNPTVARIRGLGITAPVSADAGKVLTVGSGGTSLSWEAPAAPTVGPDLALAGHLGVGFTPLSGSPPARAELRDAAAPQLRLSLDTTSHVDLQVDGDASLNVTTGVDGYVIADRFWGNEGMTAAQLAGNGAANQLILRSGFSPQQVALSADTGGDLTITAGGGDVTIAGTLHASVSGDLAGNLPNPVVAGIRGLALGAPATGDAGKVLTVGAGGTSLSWAAAPGGSVGPDLALSGSLIVGAAALSGAAVRSEAVDAANPQLRLSQTAGTFYTDFQTDTSGYFHILPSGGRAIVGSTAAPGSILHVFASPPAQVATTPGTNGIGSFQTGGQNGGATTIATTGVGGNGGGVLIGCGAGGLAASAAVSSTGGNGGAITGNGGSGGAASVAGSGINIGGTGGAINFLCGGGGNASGGATNNGGSGGAFTASGGTAGTGTTPGTGGAATVQGGLAAAAAGSKGGDATLAGRAGSSTGSGGAGGVANVTGGNAAGDGSVARTGGAVNITSGSSVGAQSGANVVVRGGAAGTSGNKGYVLLNDNGGFAGVGLTAPARAVEIRDASNPQLRISQAAAQYAEWQVDSSGNLTITPSGGTTTVSGTLVSPLLANAQSGTTYTLVLADASKCIEMTNAGAITLTIPTNASVAFPVGTVIEVWQGGAGAVTLTPAGGVTLRSNGAKLKTAGQYAVVGLRKQATDVWICSGDLSA